METRTVTINDVAAMAGVSVATVSRVLSGSGGSAAARERVEAAARALGYRKSTVERRAEGVRDHALALIISDLTNPYYGMLCAAGRTSRDYSYSVSSNGCTVTVAGQRFQLTAEGELV